MEALAQQFSVSMHVGTCRLPRLGGPCSSIPSSSHVSSLSSSAAIRGTPLTVSLASSSLPAPASRRPLALPRAQAVDAAELEADEGPALGRKYPPFAAFRIHGTGRRKTAVARVGLIEGDGNFIVNGLALSDYFQDQALLIQAVKLPLSSLGYLSKYDVVVKAHGGGLSAQAQAMMLGIARALVKVNETNKPPLKAQGMLTRDSRSVERKKYGLKKARKAPQFSKR